MTVQQPQMGQQSYQPQPGYAHPMMGQMGPMGGQFGPAYMGMAGMNPMMGHMGGPPQAHQQVKPPSELIMGPAEPANILASSQTSASVDPMPKDQTLEDGKLFFYL